MSRAVICISCHELEEDYALKVTVETALEAGFDVIVGYDNFIPFTHADILRRYPKDRVHVVVTMTRGIGNNRNMLAHKAIEFGYDVFIQSDCHVAFIVKETPLQISNNVFEHFPVEGKALLNARAIEPVAFKYIGTVHDRHDIRKIRFIGRESKWIYFHGEPVFAVETKILRRIADLQSGFIYLLPGYGYEVTDIMLTISRLGYRFDVNRSLVYAHRINKGHEDRWSRRWDREQLMMFHANMYIYSIKHGFTSPVYYKEIEEKFKDRIAIARYVNEFLPLSAQRIFDLMEKDIKEGNIVVFG